MPYIIYNPATNLYRSMANDEAWDGDISEAAVFRSEKNAAAKIRAQQQKWKYYSEQWVGHQNLSIAVKSVKEWSTAVPREVRFVFVDE